MKKIIVSLVVLLGALGILLPTAYSKDLKIGYVDILKVFNDYEKTEEYDSKLEEKKGGIESKLETKKGEIEKIQKKLSLLKEDEKKKEEEKIEKEVREYRELERKAYIDIKKERDDKMKEIFDDVTKIIETYAKKHKYDLIVDKTAVHYGKKVMDLTSEILKIANKDYKKK
tara:strand:+ start:66 stop:578 length:513 start_codon:yes stop_codon:yes gene_type:complete